MSDVEAITIRWYTEQRGRVVGNTKHWHDLTDGQKHILMDEVYEVLESFKAYYTPEPTPHELRQ
jgi:hypothetical protein